MDDVQELLEGVIAVEASSLPALVDEIPRDLPDDRRAELAELFDAIDDYAAAAQSPNTTRAYSSDWRQFEQWAARYGLATLPASPATAARCISRRSPAADSSWRRFADARRRSRGRTGSPGSPARSGIRDS